MRPTANTEGTKVVQLGGENAEKKPVLSIIPYGELDKSVTLDMSPVMAGPMDVNNTLKPVADYKWTGQYVFSVLSTICCFGPLSTIGLLHILSAQTEHRMGNTEIAKSKQKQAKVWTIASWVFGVVVIAALVYNWFGPSIIHSSSKNGMVDSQGKGHRTLKPKPFSMFVPELEFEMNREKAYQKNSMFVPELQFEIGKEKSKTTTEPFVAELHFEIQKEKTVNKDEKHKEESVSDVVKEAEKTK